MKSLFETAPQKKFIPKLLAWYKKHGRHDMPWRKTRDPYAVFVSEFMLQQTTVATVRPYYERFLKRFPTVAALAKSDLNDVLALWSGLGYYARARNLWNAMRTVHDHHRGKIPSDAEKLQDLAGVGPYTAGAIASFAFNKAAAVLDANIIRVLMRLLAIEDDPKLKAVQIILTKLAMDLASLKKGSARAVNLALMDLGSTVCVPRDPKCGVCPAAAFCLAKSYGRQNDIPMKTEEALRPTVRRLYAIISVNDRWLMGQRPSEGLFGGLWEFPGVDAPSGVEPTPFLEESVKKESGLTVRVREALTPFEHQLSHKIFVIRPYLVDLIDGKTLGEPKAIGMHYERFRWVAPFSVHKMGVSAITKRIALLVKAHSKLS